MRHRHFIIIIPATLFIFDRLLKQIVYTLPLGEVFSFSYIKFGYFLNPALFFLPAWPTLRWIALAVLVVLAIFFIIKVYEHKKTKTNASGAMLYALCLILLGGISNVYDRFAYGGVIDIVNILGFATINLADLLIVAGIIYLFLLFNKHQQPNSIK